MGNGGENLLLVVADSSSAVPVDRTRLIAQTSGQRRLWLSEKPGLSLTGSVAQLPNPHRGQQPAQWPTLSNPLRLFITADRALVAEWRALLVKNEHL